MSVFSPRRALFLSFLFLLLATAASAVTPSARYDARLVYDASTTHSILFGGATANDAATKLPYEFGDTWDWNGVRWTQLFPLHVPAARYGQVMVYDSTRSRIVMFGGRGGNGKVDLNDTWVFKDGDWKQLDTPAAPPGRVLAGGAYDPLRDRVVVFGGATISSDGKTVTPLHDTWELDGTTWTKVLADGPAVDKPLMVFDAARKVTFMLAVDSKLVAHQFTYDPAAPAWNEKLGIALPTCANEGSLAFQARNDTIFYTGGSCSSSTSIEDNLEWDGDKWNPITVKVNVGRVFGASVAYDASRQITLLFGGSPILSTAPRNELWFYNGDWTVAVDPNDSPAARSLFVFRTDPDRGVIWLFGGIDPLATYADFWKYQYGKWQRIIDPTPPQSCRTPTGAYDTVRKKLVITCSDSNTFEWDGATWKAITGLNKTPPQRLFSSMVYDENIKKSVLFGGYISDYIDQTWLWDGAAWTEVRKNLPPPRALAAMWFDSHLNRTVIFGGIGRPGSQDRITRFNDMWSFDGNGWTEIKPTTVPPPRYGAQVAVDPRSGNVLLFGGLRVDTIEVPGTGNNPPTQTLIQVYSDDFWQWDGTNWTQVNFPRIPYARENGGLAFDPSTQTMVVFGGYVGQSYLSDLWTQTEGGGWMPLITNVVKRRPVR